MKKFSALGMLASALFFYLIWSVAEIAPTRQARTRLTR